jgi:hypothetical protein
MAVLLSVGLMVAGLTDSRSEDNRRKLLDSEPDVVYLEEVTDRVLELEVIKASTVFGDKDGNRRLGTLKEGQKVPVLAITDRAYRVRGQGMTDGIAGWVSPQAFAYKDPKFVDQLKEFYQRQLKVKKLIDAKEVAIGMSMDEVTRSRGAPTKTLVRETPGGKSGRWEYIDFEEVKHYVDRVDPKTQMIYRQLVSVTREEKGKTVIEFENGFVSAMEEAENHKIANTRIIIPPLQYCW